MTRSRRLATIGSAVCALAFAPLMPAAPPQASSQAPGVSSAWAAQAPGGATATVQPDGSWQVTTGSPDWTFGGSVGEPVSHVHVTAGHDRVGTYRELDFQYQDAGSRLSGIRVYDARPLVLFRTTYLTASANAAPFPAISTHPGLPHSESYQGCFASYQFNSASASRGSPWLFFNDQDQAFLLSPASHFQQAATTVASSGTIESGIMPSITSLPAGFTQQTLLAVGNGINAVYGTWGHAMTSLQGKHRPANDQGVILNKIGYWTDHGATYYYSYDPSLGYAGTLEAVKRDWQSKGLPLGYMQLDSWWYPKGPGAQWNGNGGEYVYRAAPALFPSGLAAFQHALGLPLVTHARWVDPSSPYRSEYKMSGNVITDPRFWHQTMSYLKNAGVATYEQDWLCAGAQAQYNLTAPGAFFNDMASAAAAKGITMQYCMPLPKDFLQTTKYGNLTNMRVSNDRFGPDKWNDFLYASRLARALGVWPWSDVFMSTETDNLLLSDLSGGPVGVGDPIGAESPANIRQVVRPDGVIVKPDAPIVPTDATYIGEADGKMPAMVASTYSDHHGLRDAYVFAYARQAPAPKQIYQAENATLSGPVVASSNPGYTGTGYADYQNPSNDYAQWTVQVPAGGTYTLMFRYANGGSYNRPLAITFNGASAGTLPFAPTGGWSDWNMQGMTVHLRAGQNTIRATATGKSGGNIDYLGISPGQVPTTPTQVATFSPSRLGIKGPAYVYDYFTGTGTVVPAGGSYSATVTSGSYYVVAPISRSGIAFLGDAGKFVSLGAKRITRLDQRGGAVHATVAFARGEGPVTLHGYSASPPRVWADNGSAGPVSYDPSTHLFRFSVSLGARDRASVTISSR